MRAVMLHRSGLPHDFGAAAAQLVASLINILHAQSQMAEAVADVILVSVPIVGEFHHCIVRLIAVADEGQGEFTGWVATSASWTAMQCGL